MSTSDTCCTIVPYFKIPPNKQAVFRALCEKFVNQTALDSGVLFYGFSFDGDEAHCREGYFNAAGLLVHLDNVHSLLTQLLQHVELTRLEVHAPESEQAKLSVPMADLHPQFFTLE